MRNIALRKLTCLAASSLIAFLGQEASGQTQFDSCKKLTGNNATLIVPESASITLDGEPLPDGAEVAAFTQNGLCVGAFVWEHENVGVALWGDDTQTSDVDGLAPGEEIEFRIWEAKSGKMLSGTTSTISVKFSDAAPFYRETPEYAAGAIYELASLEISSSTKVPEQPENPDEIPDVFAVHESYPNPFNPRTTVPFDLPDDAHVEIDIYNVAGALVERLVDRTMTAGRHEVQWEAGNHPSGVYLMRVSAAGQIRTQELILLK